MKLIDILKEAYKSPEEAITYLEKLVTAGELDKDTLYVAHNRLIKAYNKMVAGKISPEKRAASAAKGRNTKILNKIKDKAEKEVFDKLRISVDQDSSLEGSGKRIGLGLNRYKDKALQKKFNTAIRDLIVKYAKEAGITDQSSINSALAWHR